MLLYRRAVDVVETPGRQFHTVLSWRMVAAVADATLHCYHDIYNKIHEKTDGLL